MTLGISERVCQKLHKRCRLATEFADERASHNENAQQRNPSVCAKIGLQGLDDSRGISTSKLHIGRGAAAR
jgi:hypothetical protein